MTQAEIKLCSLLLHEHFGEIVEKIGTYLVRTGAQPLRMIVGETGLLLDQVRPKPVPSSFSPAGEGVRQPRPSRDQPQVSVTAAELPEEPRVGNGEEDEGAENPPGVS